MPPEAALKERIVGLIREGGPMPVDRYFAMCVSDPQHGYWQRKATIGATGDFITAPEISQIFGELLGLWCAVTWTGMGEPKPVRLVELGPGRGTLMSDVLRTTARAMPALHAAAHVDLVELSAPFRQRQASALEGLSARAPHWHDDVSRIPDGAAILIANEFLDALPIRQYIRQGGAWHERVVLADDAGKLRFGSAPASPELVLPDAPDGAVVEVRDGERAVLEALARRADPFVALFIDYGPAQHAFGDTLQAMRRHAYADPLADPGHCDLTAHVQFESLAHQARNAGFAVAGPVTQAEFLGALGLAHRASRLMSANPSQAADIELAAQRLVAPTGMGSLFKVLAIYSPALPKPPPFP